MERCRPQVNLNSVLYMKMIPFKLPSYLQSSPSTLKRRRLAVGSVVTVIAVGAAALTVVLVAQQTESTPVVEDPGVAAFADPWSVNAAREKDPEFIKQSAEAAFSILNPVQANELGLQDPAVRAALAESTYTLLNPLSVEAELKKDPAFRQQQEEAFATLRGPADPE